MSRDLPTPAAPTNVTGISEVHDHLGVILAAQGRDAEAEAALRKSVEALIATRYVWVLGEAVVDLGRFLAQRGRFAEASELIEPYAQKMASRGPFWTAGEIDDIRRKIAAIRHLTRCDVSSSLVAWRRRPLGSGF